MVDSFMATPAKFMNVCESWRLLGDLHTGEGLVGPSIRAGSVAQTPESWLPRRLTSPNSLNASMWHGQTLHMKYNRAASTSSLSPPRPLHHTHTRSPFSFPLPIPLFRPHTHPPTPPTSLTPSPQRPKVWRLLATGVWSAVGSGHRGWMFGTGIAGVWRSVVFSDTAVGTAQQTIRARDTSVGFALRSTWPRPVHGSSCDVLSLGSHGY